MELTAKELHAVYAPLWEKVPETRPRQNFPIPVFGLEYQPADDECGIDEGWYWRDNGGWLVVPPMDTRCAAALCRVEVEDWLHARGLAIVPVLKGPTRSAQWFLANGITVDRTGSAMVGTYTDEPNIHAALVEAAIAVATDRR